MKGCSGSPAPTAHVQSDRIKSSALTDTFPTLSSGADSLAMGRGGGRGGRSVSLTGLDCLFCSPSEAATRNSRPKNKFGLSGHKQEERKPTGQNKRQHGHIRLLADEDENDSVK